MIDACVIDGLEKGIQIVKDKGIQHITGEVFEGANDGTVHSVCALGALALGLGIDPIRRWEEEQDYDDDEPYTYDVASFYDTSELQPKLYDACPALAGLIDGRPLFEYTFLRNDGTLNPENRPYRPTLPELLEELKALEVE